MNADSLERVTIQLDLEDISYEEFFRMINARGYTIKLVVEPMESSEKKR